MVHSDPPHRSWARGNSLFDVGIGRSLVNFDSMLNYVDYSLVEVVVVPRRLIQIV